MYTSIRTVLNDLNEKIPAEFWDENEILERCSKAMEKIGTYVSLEKKVAYLTVIDHVGYLPKGLVNIEQIAYKRSNIITDLDRASLSELVGIENESYYDGFFVSPYYYNNFRPLRLATSGFSHGRDCEDCNNVESQGEQEYVVRPNGTIMTSFKDGHVCIAYDRYPIDEEGDFLIPDKESVKQAITNYCLAHIFEKRMIMMEQGAQGLFEWYFRKAEVDMTKAKAEMMMPGVDVYENLRQMQRLIPVNRRYYSFFGNLATPEYTYPSGIFHNNRRL